MASQHVRPSRRAHGVCRKPEETKALIAHLEVGHGTNGERGRKPVILYSASKAGLSRYLEGLDHKFRSQGLKTVCVKPGFVKTGMTAGLAPPPFAGKHEGVARDILKAIDRGAPVVYSPGVWRYIMMVIRTLPRFVTLEHVVLW